MKNKKGFTLAEVLITLGIIGIVAAMTIPTLINNYQKTQYVAGLKKAYSEMNQALIQMAADNNCIGDLKCTGLFASGTSNESLGNELVKYFKVAKNCGANDAGGPTITGCMSDKVSTYYDGTGTIASSDYIFLYRFITVGGMSYTVKNNKTNCGNSSDGFSNHVTNNLNQLCGLLIVDINGLKGPNNTGRDIFHFHITNGKGPLLYPLGGADESYNLDGPLFDSGSPQSCHAGYTYGQQCAARIIEEDWQMKY